VFESSLGGPVCCAPSDVLGEVPSPPGSVVEGLEGLRVDERVAEPPGEVGCGLVVRVLELLSSSGGGDEVCTGGGELDVGGFGLVKR
jgi:hypothetical protein